MLLLGWLERHFDTATASQREAFAQLLELPDADLERFLASSEHPLQAALEPSGRPSL